MSADFRVTLPAVSAGTWRVRAEWAGRGIAGLWLTKPGGEALMKRIAASPLELAFEVDEGWAARGEQLVVKFSTTTDRGALAGELSVTPPRIPSEEPAERSAPAEPSAPSEDAARTPPLRGPARCLEPGFDEGPVGRALRRLASSLETSDDDERSWCLGWVRRVAETMETEGGVRRRRGAVDVLWERLLRDRVEGAPVDDAVRQLLSTVEDLVRREGISRDPASVRRRQEDLRDLLTGCLVDDPA